jgi:ABC-type sugar transport systems, permease components
VKTAYNKQESRNAYLLLAPILIGFLVFGLLPIISSLILSFTRWDLFSAPKWIGLDNFKEIFQDSLVFTSLRNTILFVVLNVPLGGVIFPLLLAVLLSQKIRGVKFFRTVYFLPVVTLSVSAGFVWNWMFTPEFGIINYLFTLIHLPPQRWLLAPNLALISLIMVNVWKWLGYNMIIFLAALNGIPNLYYEAAKVDGANAWQVFRKITFPLLMPTTFFVVVVSIIGSFQFFDLVYIMTQGGPGDATTVFNYYIYQNAFKFSRMGYAAALAWVLFVIIFLITLAQMKLSKERISYEY